MPLRVFNKFMPSPSSKSRMSLRAEAHPLTFFKIKTRVLAHLKTQVHLLSYLTTQAHDFMCLKIQTHVLRAEKLKPIPLRT